MGIRDLNKFLSINVPDGIRQVDLKKLKGKKVAIDTSIFLYKYIYKNDCFLEGFFQQIFRLVSNNIVPIYVFDGIPPEEKSHVLNGRRRKRKNLENKKNELTKEYNTKINNDKEYDARKILEEIDKINKKNIKIKPEHITKLKYMFDMMGIKYVHPDCEADIYCNVLCQNNVVEFCISDDMDLLTGCNLLIRNFKISSNYVSIYNLNNILNTLHITKEQWVDLCILCGCDYTKTIKGINYLNAYKLILKYGNIENIIKNITDILGDGVNLDNFNYIICRKIFNTYNTLNTRLDKQLINIGYLWGNQYNDILNYIKQETKLTNKQIITRLNRIYKIN